jgi:23S rRNA (uracil1939-C5)-methyltransferase
MTMPDELTLRPERFVAGGDALAHAPDGRVVFVRGAVPGDEVIGRVVEVTRGWTRAELVEVVSPSADRVVPPCPQRLLGCGGCDWQHVAVRAQLHAKVEVVRDAFRRTARLPDADIRPGAGVAPNGHRTTIRVVGDRDGRASYRVERSHDTIPAAGCLVAHPLLRDLLDRISLTPGLELTLRAAAATGERTAVWDIRRGDVADLPDGVRVGETATVHERVGDHQFRVSAGAFFQSGPAAAELLVAAVRRAAPELATAAAVLDAYAGVGLFALAATSPSSRVIAVESSRHAVADAEINLARRDALVVRGEVGAWRHDRSAGPIDVVIADPSRTGLGRPGTAAVASTAAPVVVLVSCDAASAARDAALLATHGYRHDGGEVLDLFPHTHHVECVTRFVRAG